MSALAKEYAAPASATEGLAGYWSLIGRPKKARTLRELLALRRPFVLKWDEARHPRDRLGRFGGSLFGASSSEVVAAATRTAMRFGYPVAAVAFSEEQRTFELNGTSYAVAGEANLATGVITIYSNWIGSERAAEGAMAHEIGHQQYERTIRLQPIAPQEAERLAADDGVSGYSRDWWAAVADGKASPEQALHETFAEVSRLAFEAERDGTTLEALGVKPSWVRLHAVITGRKP